MSSRTSRGSATVKVGDGVVVKGDGRTGIVVFAEDAAAGRVEVDLDDGSGVGAFTHAELGHMLPPATYKPGWWPYVPSDGVRRDFAKAQRNGLTAAEVAAAQAREGAAGGAGGDEADGFPIPAGWQQTWTALPDGCGDFCCYSYECGAISCAACKGTATWPRCAKEGCTRAIRNRSSTACKCGHPVGGDLRFPVRYVCATQVAEDCGDGQVLNPTFCTVLCERCFETVDHPHSDFIAVHPDGRHEPVRKGFVSELARWRGAVQAMGAAAALPEDPPDGDEAADRAYVRRVRSKEGVAAIVAALPRGTVGAGETVEDEVDLETLTEGQEYVAPWAASGCPHGFLPETVEMLLRTSAEANGAGVASWEKCPCCE